MILAGDKITTKNLCLTHMGGVIWEPGDELTVERVDIRPGYWSRLCPDIYVPDKITGIVLEECDGIFSPESFNLPAE